MTPRIAMSVIGAAATLFLACASPDDRCGSGSPTWWDERLLNTKAHEDTPSVRWYWCERALAPDAPAQEDWLGPITNLADGGRRGEGKWVRVFADEVTQMRDAAERARTMPTRVGGVEARRRMLWRWTAAAKAIVGGLDQEVARAYAAAAGGKTPPEGVMCFSTSEMYDRFANHPGCTYPDPDSQPNPDPSPPGAIPPDRGGIDVPPGTTPTGGGDEGDL